MTDLTPEDLDELEALAKAACLPDGDPHWMHMVDEGGDCPEKAKAIIWSDFYGLMPIVTLEDGEFSDKPEWRKHDEAVLRFIGEMDPAMVLNLIAAARERDTIAEERDELRDILSLYSQECGHCVSDQCTHDKRFNEAADAYFDRIDNESKPHQGV